MVIAMAGECRARPEAQRTASGGAYRADPVAVGLRGSSFLRALPRTDIALSDEALAWAGLRTGRLAPQLARVAA